MNTKTIIIIIIIIVFCLVAINWNKIILPSIKTNVLMFLIVKRGILTVNCDWWKISDMFKDGTGIELYKKIKTMGKVVPILTYGLIINIITDINFVKQLLDNSPFIFGAGKIKYDFFKSFMGLNLGISEGCPWMRRRKFNEHVLTSDKPHIFSTMFNRSIEKILQNNEIPLNLIQFNKLARLITMKIVFNENKINESLFNVISQANSFSVVFVGSANINKTYMKNYNQYILKHIRNPNKGSLLYLTKNANSELTDKEILHQVPHWIFPINGITSVASLKLLLLLSNHPKILHKVMNDIKQNKYDYLRKCILELLRLNNPVSSTFRTLLRDYSFDDNYKYKKGEQFVILNSPVLRDPITFIKPNKFIPKRWTDQLEKSYYAVMFNQGPQRCPGKELAIFIIQSFITNYLHFSGILYGKKLISNKINTNYIPQAINPCTIQLKII